MPFQNACVCDANADQKLPRYCRDHITRRNILATTNKIVASADRPLLPYFNPPKRGISLPPVGFKTARDGNL